MAQRDTALHALERRRSQLGGVRVEVTGHVVWARSRMGELRVVRSLAGPAGLVGVLLHFAVLPSTS